MKSLRTHADFLAHALALTLVLVATTGTCLGGSGRDEPVDEAKALAVKLTTQGAATFDTFNARAMAEYYTEDAQLFTVSREGEGLKVETRKGRSEIEKGYAELFKKPETIKSRNHVEYAKFLAPDILAIAGTFDLDTLKPDSPKIPFYQVRVKQGDRWLMSSLRIFILPAK